MNVQKNVGLDRFSITIAHWLTVSGGGTMSRGEFEISNCCLICIISVFAKILEPLIFGTINFPIKSLILKELHGVIQCKITRSDKVKNHLTIEKLLRN